MKVEMQLRGLEGVLNTLLALPKEVVSKRGGPVKAALRKGALVILAAEKANLRAVTSNATSSGERESTGLLAKSLIASRGKAPKDGKGERYLVRVKRKVYATSPDGRARIGKSVTTTIANAQRLEYGTSSQPKEPWIRPAFQAKAGESIRTIERELIAGVNKVVAKLAQQNRGK